MPIKNYFNNKGKLAGYLKDNIYRKQVNSKKHKMKIYDAYGISSNIVVELEKEGCEEIRIKETDTEIIYRTSLDNFIKNGIERNFDGQQIFLPLKYFEVNNEKQKVLI